MTDVDAAKKLPQYDFGNADVHIISASNTECGSSFRKYEADRLQWLSNRLNIETDSDLNESEGKILVQYCKQSNLQGRLRHCYLSQRHFAQNICLLSMARSASNLNRMSSLLRSKA